MPEGNNSSIKLHRDKRLHILDPGGVALSERKDEDLMLAHGEGCQDSFAELLRRHQKSIMNFIYRMVQKRSVAEELTQEVFMALVKNAKRYQPTAKFTTYLYKIASNLVSKEWQKRNRRPSIFSLSAWSKDKGNDDKYGPLDTIGDEKASVLTKFQHGEISEAVNEALQQIPAHQREAFVLHRFQEMPYDEVARVTSAPIGTIKSRVVRAERALRPLLESFREYI